ncbi:nucleotidyltransferase family protein [Candidatus Margulisiibacteriota bacterium]
MDSKYIQKYINSYKHNRERDNLARKELQRQVKEDIVKIKESLLKTDPTISKMIVFGSFLTEHFNKRSDIDIALDADKAKFYSLSALANRVSRFSVDLVDIRNVKGFFKDNILKNGVTLYEK